MSKEGCCFWIPFRMSKPTLKKFQAKPVRPASLPCTAQSLPSIERKCQGAAFLIF